MTICKLLILVGIKLKVQLIVTFLQDRVSLFQSAILNLSLLKHLASEVVFTQLVILVDRPIKQLIEVRHKLVDDSLSSPVSLLH